MHSRFSIGLIGSFSAGFQRQSSWVHVANIGTGLRSRFRGNLAEWSKALALGASPRGRGFEPHSYHTRRMAAALSATVLFWHFWLFFSCFFLYVLLPPRCLAGLRHPARARASGKPAPVASISTASHHHYVLASLACCVGAPAEPTANRRSSTFAASCMSISNPPSVQSGGVAACLAWEFGAGAERWSTCGAPAPSAAQRSPSALGVSVTACPLARLPLPRPAPPVPAAERGAAERRAERRPHPGGAPAAAGGRRDERR